EEYQERLLARIYADLAPHDPEGILRHEWVNARGAIARFERMAIEIRVLDVQECPAADVAYAAAIIGTLRSLCDERWASTEPLELDRSGAAVAKLWERLIDRAAADGTLEGTDERFLEQYLRSGTLSTRIRSALGSILPTHGDFVRVYRALCDALAEGRSFDG